MNLKAIRRFLNLELFLQIGAIIALLLNIPFLRQITVFVYLSFLPGYLILKLARMNKSSRIETFFFSLGLSLALVMFLCVLINEVYPLLGIMNPLSMFPISVSLFSVTTVLYAFSIRNKTELASTRIHIQVDYHTILLFSIAALVIMGMIYGDLSGNSSLLLVLIVVIAVLFVCSFSQKLIPSKFYPLLVFVTSFFLLFHVSLVSKYLVGYDVNLEMYFSRLTYDASFWDRTIPYAYNSMLSITILPVTYSKLMGIDLKFIFKSIIH